VTKKLSKAAIVLATTLSIASLGCSGHVGIDSKDIATNASTKPNSPLPTYRPQAKDFRIKINQTKKQCFGTAGCNISFQIAPTYSGPLPDPTRIFTVSYKVTGSASGAYVNSFTFQDGQAKYLHEEYISTKTDKVVPQASILQVTEN
jgi:hypothetical protein